MSQSRIPSPARSQGAVVTPRRHKALRTRSVDSPARSSSGRLSAVIQFKENNKDSFVLSPAPSRRSLLNDDTNIEEPKRRSWWKKLGDNSRDVMEVLNDNKILGSNEAVEEYIDIEVLSQEKKNYTIDLPDSSDSESISSIVIPQRKLFTQKDLQVPNKYGQLVGTRESLAKLHKSNVADKTVNVAPKNLFGQNRPRAKPVFPAALLNISPNKTANKTKEIAAPEVKVQVRSLFGNRPGSKRKNMFADFIVSESEDEISEIQPKVFGFPKKANQRRDSSTSRSKREHSPTSSITTDIEMDEWQHLPSSTMVENQLEDMMAAKTPVKRARLSKLTETKETIAEKEKSSEEEQELKYDDDDAIGEAAEKIKETTNKVQNENGHQIQNKDTEEIEVATEQLAEDVNKDKRQSKLQNMSKGTNKSLNENKSTNISLNKTNNVSRNKANNVSLKKTNELTEVDEEVHRNKRMTKENVSKETVQDASQNKINASQDINSGKIHDNVNHEEQMEIDTEENLQNLEKELEKDNSKVVPEFSQNYEVENEEQLEDSYKDNQDENDDDNEEDSEKEESNHEDVEVQSEKEESNHEGVEVQSEKEESELEDDEVQSEKEESEHEEDEVQSEKEVSEHEDVEVQSEKEKSEHEDVEVHSEKEESEHEDVEVQSEKEESEHEDVEVQSEKEESEHEDDEVQSEKKDSIDKNEKIVNQIQNEGEANATGSEKNELNVDEAVQSNDKIEIDVKNAHTNNSNENRDEIQDGSDQQKKKSDTAIARKENEDSIEEISKGNAGNNQVMQEEIRIEERGEDREESGVEPQNSLEEPLVESEDEQEKYEEEDQEENEESQIANEAEVDNESEMEIDNEGEMEVDNEGETEVENEEGESEHEESRNETENEDQDNDEDRAEAQDSDEDQNESEELQYESETEEEATNGSNVDAQDESENEIQDSNGQEETEHSDNVAETPNVTHDTTGRNRKKNESNVNSPEAILHDKTNQIESFTEKGRNTSIRTTTMLKNLNIRPSLAPPRESTGMSDGTKNSSAEGSGWDSHRTTRKTLRQTFGKDFTPRKSLRALVMEKSAKHQMGVNDLTTMTSKFPQANSTELPEASMVPDDDDIVAESNHDVSKRTRQTTLEMYLEKIKKQNIERKLKMEEEVRNSLKGQSRDIQNPFKVPSKPMFPLRKVAKPAPKPKSKPARSALFLLDDLPQEVKDDMKYKPPKRFQANAAWITKRLYKFLESKLEAKYDYKARVRAEKLVESIYHFAKNLRRHDVAPSDAVDVLKQEMARLDVVKTHFDFYQFFHEYMPREIRIKVVPDIVNKISMPRHGVFSDILRGKTVQG